jgi:hypothetical protein
VNGCAGGIHQSLAGAGGLHKVACRQAQLVNVSQPAGPALLALQLDSLLELCPVLPPAVLPQGYDVEDLWALANTEGGRHDARAGAMQGL